MNPTPAYDTEITAIMQAPMDKGTQAFPEAMSKICNLAMCLERELHLGAKRCER